MESNAKATVWFTVGLCGSACITTIVENWIRTNNVCDVIRCDLSEEGAPEVLCCMGVDLFKPGSFVAELEFEAKEDEAPDYKILNMKEVQTNG